MVGLDLELDICSRVEEAKVRDAGSPCAVCGAPQIEIVSDFNALPRVTSDCRPFPAGGSLGICACCHTIQKPASARWHDEAAAIYSRYAIFRQALDGAEQRVFDPATGNSLRRSEVVLKRLNEAFPLPERGRALDVGCGNGPTLRALSAAVPHWELYGHEISDAGAESLAAIRGFRKLYTGDPADIDDQFDLITFCHSLEHIPDPVAALKALRTKLAPGGRLLVQVPNVRPNIYDLVVADHRSHFDISTLAFAAKRAGFAHAHVYDDWAFKELTMVAADESIEARAAMPALAPLGQPDLEQRVHWLAAVLQHAHQAAASAETFGLFGTAIAATWTFGPLAEQVAFFVDEDASRIGREHEDRPILAPDRIPQGATVFVPLLPRVASAVARRLRDIVDVRVPPAQVFDCNN
jgi:SAM-dependent methyltransferase